MKKPVFTGVCTALVTPFSQNSINYQMLEKILQRQMRAGIHAFVICGTTGEASTLSDEEKCSIVQKSKEIVGSENLILAGTGSNSTEHAVKLSQMAESNGADGLLVVSPYYNKATPNGLLSHYRSIADAVNIPVILYNVPTRTGLDIPAEIYRQLSQHPRIAGVKEAKADLGKIIKTLSICSENFNVWSGNDNLSIPVITAGGSGVISVLSNLCPYTMKVMIDYALNGNYKKAMHMQKNLLPLMEAMFCEVNPIPVKAAMKIIGIDCGGCRLPLCEPTPENFQMMEALLEQNMEWIL